MHFVTKYLSGLKRTVSADNRAPLIIYHQGGEEGEWRILGGRISYGFRKKGGGIRRRQYSNKTKAIHLWIILEK